MGALRISNLYWTKEESWALEKGSVTKHEYFDGEVYAMTGAKPHHNDIAGNIYASLHNQLRGSPCRPRASDQSVATRCG